MRHSRTYGSVEGGWVTVGLTPIGSMSLSRLLFDGQPRKLCGEQERRVQSRFLTVAEEYPTGRCSCGGASCTIEGGVLA
jgi:hypothetical protein